MAAEMAMVEPMLASDLPRRLFALAVFLGLAAGAWFLLEGIGADYIWAKTAIFLFVLFFLLGSGVWIGLALMGVAYVGVEAFTPRPAGDAMITTIWTSSSSWTLTALPLFIWMGEILFRTRLSEDMFKGSRPGWRGCRAGCCTPTWWAAPSSPPSPALPPPP